MLRPVQGSCGREWAFEGKPNCFCTVGATESVSVNKAGMCWHITRGRGRSRQCWVAPQECKFLSLLSQCTNVFWDRSVFYFLSRSYFGLDCKVYMVKVSYEQKPFRREVMRTYGASVTPSPSMTTHVGRKILAEHPDTTGSLGCAISEAVEVAISTPGYRYVLGSVLNQVLLHQSVIGLETKAALDKIGVKPDIIIGCAGGGSNLGGLISPFMGEKLRGEADYRIIAVEPASCPSLTRGKFVYDFCDTGMVCPLAKMYTLGSGFIPSPNHAGGLRYHGMSSILSQLYHDGLMEARSVEQTSVFEAAEQFAHIEGILPAPESSHAIRAAIDEALKCKETGEEKTIVFGLTGTGYFDMVAYEKFHDGQMSDYIPTDADLQKGFDGIPRFPGNEI